MPFMITEFASATAGGDKQKWIQDMLNHIEKYSNIKIAVWWNHADYSSNGEIARSYFINDNKQNLNIFKEAAERNNGQYFNSVLCVPHWAFREPTEDDIATFYTFVTSANQNAYKAWCAENGKELGDIFNGKYA